MGSARQAWVSYQLMWNVVRDRREQERSLTAVGRVLLSDWGEVSAVVDWHVNVGLNEWEGEERQGVCGAGSMGLDGE